jgi:hypothetical protein
LNDVPVKIKGVANHQYFAGVVVAVPDNLQVYVSFALNNSQPLLCTKSLPVDDDLPSLSLHVLCEKTAIDGCQRMAHGAQHAFEGECQSLQRVLSFFTGPNATTQALLHAKNVQG